MRAVRLAARAARRARVLVLAVTTMAAAPCLAQDARQPVKPDSIFQQAQRLASDGDLAAARMIADSVLNASPEGSAVFVEALFRRATFTAAMDAARRDYLRVAVEYSLSARAEDALLRLAQMEMARGDRATARKYLERLALEHAEGKLRAQGQYWMGRVLLEEGALPQACAALGEARARLLPTDVELANQVSYYGRQCENTGKGEDRRATPDSAGKGGAVMKGDEPAAIDSAGGRRAAGDRLRGPAVVKAPAKGPAWSAQVAAYGEKAEAERVAKKLLARGLDARVTAERPFRVRLGRYARREDAAALVEKLRGQKMTAIVVEAERR